MTATQQPDTVTVRAASQRRRGAVLLAVAAWNVWLWGTRIRNLVADAGEFSAAFVGAHAVLYGVSLVLAAVIAVIGWRMVREGRRGSRP